MKRFDDDAQREHVCALCMAVCVERVFARLERDSPDRANRQIVCADAIGATAKKSSGKIK